jgi:hypothetical protein
LRDDDFLVVGIGLILPGEAGAHLACAYR